MGRNTWNNNEIFKFIHKSIKFVHTDGEQILKKATKEVVFMYNKLILVNQIMKLWYKLLLGN